MEPGCIDRVTHQGSEKCLRGESAAGLLGDIKDEASITLLASVISRATKGGPERAQKSNMHKIAMESLKKIGTPEALNALDKAAKGPMEEPRREGEPL